MDERIVPPVFDSLVLAAVAEEIGRHAAGQRIAGVLQADEHTVALRLRAGRASRGIICSIHPRRARCLLGPMPARAADHPFVHQLRARLEGARLRDARVEPFERTLTLRFETLEGEIDLIVEVMARHSNLLLVEGERIAGLFKPVTAAMSRVRPLQPGGRYHPPPRGRPLPPEVSLDPLQGWLAEGGPVAETLVRHLLGISPPVAAHLARRAGFDPDAAAPSGAAGRVLEALGGLIEVMARRGFDPVWYADTAGHAVAYAAMPLLTYQTLDAHHTASMSDAAGRVIDTAAATDTLEEQRRSLLARIDDVTRRARRAEEEVSASMEEAARAPQWRRWGELLLAYGSTVPAGADRVTVPDFDGSPLTITVDPRRGPIGSAQAYFRRHAKAAAAGRALPRRLQQLQEEATYLAQLRLFAGQATSREEIHAVAMELRGAGEGRRAHQAHTADRRGRGRTSEPEPGVRTLATGDGRRILVGRNSRGNDHITFHLAGPDDLWLHARGMAGAHVILKIDGRMPSPQEVEEAAGIAAYFSEGRGAAKVPVDVTARRHVRKPRGARPGMVTYRQERTLMVEPRLPGGAGPNTAGTGQ